ncbi:hypothetical protein ACKVWC_008632 [Pyricularia oryzae]|nr:hypothetical protein MCOR01_001971 [Pyricularia oryzae]KAI6257841.1 hypothetical protein MCOR19_005786 [Pyricularia oryzae]KAI6338032.1 hypothetical protein MCOR30_003146 [Pyricularia oryzae]KAI6491396.1 hypothetical protein MCOR18_002041 [Pyricularia oryzae]KAI6609868.1 hypothetical protein MCOR08_011239 [Pyricularia oryzae]
MRLFKLATLLVVAASGVQALAVTRDGIDNQAVQVNGRRDANAKLVARANEGQGANEVVPPFHDGATSPVQSVEGGDGNAPRAGRRQRLRQKMNAQWNNAVTGWGPKAVDSCKCAAKSAYSKCKCAAEKFADSRRKKSSAATAASSDQPNLESQGGKTAAAAPKASFLETCKHGIKYAGEKGQVLGCKLKDMAQERFPKLRKSTASNGIEIAGSPIPRTRSEGSQEHRVEKRGRDEHEQEQEIEKLWGNDDFGAPRSRAYLEKPKPRVSTSDGEATGPVSDKRKWQQSIGDKCKCFGQKVGEQMSKAGKACKCVNKRAIPTMTDACKSGKEACKSAYERVAPAINNACEAGKAACRSAYDRIAPAINNACESGKAACKPVYDRVAPAISSACESGKAACKPVYDRVAPAISNACESGKAACKSAYDRIAPAVSNACESGKAACKPAYDRVAPAINNACEYAGKKMTEGKEACKSAYGKLAVPNFRKQRVAGEAAATKPAETENDLESNSPGHQNSRRSGSPTSADAVEGVKPPRSGLKRTGNSWDLAGYFKQACSSAEQKLEDGRCASGGGVAKGTPSSPNHQYQGLSQEDPDLPGHSHPGSRSSPYQRLPQEDPDSPKKHPKRAESADRSGIPGSPHYAAQPRPFPDPADRPGYQTAWAAHKQMAQEMGAAVKHLVKGQWRTKHAQQGQPQQQASSF